MVTHLKTGIAGAQRKAAADAVRITVADILSQVEAEGDRPVRRLSLNFDCWDREDFRLTRKEIEACLSEVGQSNLNDILFAQRQIRNFAEHQRASIHEIEVETLPRGHAGPYPPGLAAIYSSQTISRVTCLSFNSARTARQSGSSCRRWPRLPRRFA